MNLPEIKNDLLRKLGIENPSDAPANIIQDVLTALNMAGQLLNASGDPFWLLTTDSVSLSSVVTSKVIDGHSVKIVRSSDNIPLLRCESLHQLDNYAAIYLGDTGEGPHDAQAYYVETKANPADGGDVLVTIHFGPTDLSEETITTTFCPGFVDWVTADLSDDQKSPKVPFAYVETVFLPLARFYMTRSHWFNDTELEARLREDFSNAVTILRQVNPALHIPHLDQVKQSKGGKR